MNNTMTPAKGIAAGQWIEHDLMPGYAMEVREVRACEPEPPRSAEHDSYKITDPEGQTDWLCAFDVHAVRRG